MSPPVKLLLIVVVAVAVWYVVTRLRNAQPKHVAFQPVAQLPADRRAAIEDAIAKDQLITAVRLYRDATGAGLAAAKAAVQTHRAKSGA